MPAPSLGGRASSGGGGRPSKRQVKPAKPIQIASIAHDIDAKARTEDVINADTKDKDFSSLMLSDLVLKGLKDSGFVRPSPIQLAAIPNAKIGLDMIVQSKSGTGKTCVYVVTALEMIKSELPGLQVLVVAPTREIALQGVEVASQIGSSLPAIKIATFIGGMPLSEDRVKAQHCHMAVGTPGRLKQVLDEGILNADTVRLVIMDEADKLLEPSFLQDTSHILNALPQNKQVMALSATYPKQLADVAERFMRSPQHVRPGLENQVLHGTAQFVMALEASPSQPKQNQIKQSALLKILSSIPYNQCLVFSNFQIIAQSCADFLNSRGFPAIAISAGQDQTRRIQAIQTFKSFKCRILCSTDLTARGIDAENVNLVVNLDVPDDHNTYLHRIGRGGRYGAKSVAVSLAPEGKELTRLRRIVTKTGSSVKILPATILPKDIRNEDLEILEGLDQAEVDKMDKPTKISDGDDENENVIKSEVGAKRQNNKIKRRGKKKKGGANNDPSDCGTDPIDSATNPHGSDIDPSACSDYPPDSEIPAERAINVDFEKMLSEAVKAGPPQGKALSYGHICELAANGSGLWTQHSEESTADPSPQLTAMAEHFLAKDNSYLQSFKAQMERANNSLGQIPLNELFERVQNEPGLLLEEPGQSIMLTGQDPPAVACSLGSVSSQLSSTESVDYDHNEGEDLETCSDPDPCEFESSLGADGRSGRAEPLGQDWMALGQAGHLLRWMRNVERQRQIIQDRVYWDTVTSFNMQK